MPRRCHEASFHWIIVQILQLLQHDLVAHHRLRMESFLPKLVLALELSRMA